MALDKRVMSDWYALYTEPRKEPLAADQLVRRGFTVLFPHIPEWRGLSTHARLVRKAYYPRYLFVCTDKLWSVQETPGVIGLVRSTDRRPFRIPQEAVQGIFDKVDADGSIHENEAPRSKYGLRKGSRVRVAEGNPFWGMVATVAKDVDGTMVSVLLKILGADRVVRLSVGKIEPQQNGLADE